MSDKLEKMGKFIEKKHWEKLNKFLEGGDDVRKELAVACGKANTDETCNILTTLLHDKNEEVQIAAIHSLGEIGNDHATAQLQWMMDKLTPDKKEMIDAIHAAIKNVKGRQ